MSSEDKHGEKVMREIEKHNFVRDGGIKLPPGFRFQPTDQEIVFQYLIRKVFSCPLPASIVPEIVNICKFNPWDLPGDWEQDRYFFSKKEAKYGNGNRANRASGDGYWKATGFDKQITRCCNGNPNSRKREIITGMKKKLVFHKGKPNHSNNSTIRTNWIMHEYRLVHSPALPTTNCNDQKSWIQMGNWVLCHIFLNKGSRNLIEYDNTKISSKHLIMHHDSTRSNYDIRIENNEVTLSSSSSTSSCGSSEVTQEVSSSRGLILDHDIN